MRPYLFCLEAGRERLCLLEPRAEGLSFIPGFFNHDPALHWPACDVEGSHKWLAQGFCSFFFTQTNYQEVLVDAAHHVTAQKVTSPAKNLLPNSSPLRNDFADPQVQLLIVCHVVCLLSLQTLQADRLNPVVKSSSFFDADCVFLYQQSHNKVNTFVVHVRLRRIEVTPPFPLTPLCPP